MALVGSARAMAIYNTIDVSALNSDEQAALLSQLESIYGADTSYIQANAVVVPGSMEILPGVEVATAGSPTAQTGATTAPGPVVGSGLVT